MPSTNASSTRTVLRGRWLAATMLALAQAIWPALGTTVLADEKAPRPVDFNREIRPILSNNCLVCHGPDEKQRQAGLRLDTEEGALADLGGYTAIVRGKPEKSELLRRLTATDPGERMPPHETGKRLSPRDVELIRRWISEGAPYAQHWSYVKPVRPAVPDVEKVVRSLRDRTVGSRSDPTTLASWPRNEIDRFVLARMLEDGLTPTPEADRYALIRRVSLDLTGLPPTLQEVEQFVDDTSPEAYEKLVDRLLAKKSYGEHWARTWLDLARYADSAGYADDPSRTIWAYRDYVIRSLNANKPFDRFTIEQIAGDLLPKPMEDQIIATAFHRNTLTNNEGGTNDEEFRNVAVVDRVNTTMAVWMGTTVMCAQCHDHKYDPISQEEYFRLFAFFNNSEDADRRDESPLLEIWTEEQERRKAAWQEEIARLEKKLATPTAELIAAQARWEKAFATELEWHPLPPSVMKSKAGAAMSRLEDGSVLVERGGKTDVYTVELPLDDKVIASPRDAEVRSRSDRTTLAALRLEALPHESLPNKGPGHAGGNFVVSRVTAAIAPPAGTRLAGRYLRVEIPGKQKILSLAEVQVFRGEENLARKGEAKQSSTAFGGPAWLATDGNTDGRYNEARSTTHTAVSDDPWWEVDLGSEQPIDRVVLWNRTDNDLHTRLSDFRITLLDAERKPVWEQAVTEPPNPSAEFSPSGVRAISFAAAHADYAQPSFDAANVLDNKDPANKGWAVGGQAGKPHSLTLIPSAPVAIAPGSRLTVTIEQVSKHENHTLGRFRIAVSSDPRAGEFARTPENVLAILKTPAESRTEAQRAELARHFLSVAPELTSDRDRLAALKKQLAEMKPYTNVPIMRELPEGKRRTTHVQHRGNFLDTGDEVTAGVPTVFPPLSEGAPRDRLTLARWLVDESNPLTARVVVNRYWEKLFGIGLVASSEEFGSQGELPSHPELLDWLAVEFMSGPSLAAPQRDARDEQSAIRNSQSHAWDIKRLLRLIVTSATYRQSSRVTPELLERDPDNRLLARGPRFRLTAEQIRDQALFVGGLLSDNLYGPPVKPPQPELGLNAAFGGGIDWKPSEGEDRYRRGLYTTWRRSSPYPSMATFDAPNREVCTVRRARTNTPLQALVTLNDPVYVEAAQALARRMLAHGKATAEKARYGFRLCLARPPKEEEIQRLVQLYESAYERYAREPELAQQIATKPLGAPPDGADTTELAAWTVVANVLLNLDEIFMKR